MTSNHSPNSLLFVLAVLGLALVAAPPIARATPPARDLGDEDWATPHGPMSEPAQPPVGATNEPLDPEPLPERTEANDHQPLDARELADWDHFEFSMGFVGGLRRFDRMAFRGDPSLDPSLWRARPFDGVQAYGLRYDVRLVVAYTRMTVGLDIPFTQYPVDETVRRTEDGAQSTVAEVKPFAFRFGIGAEIPVGPVAPFVDILGSIHSVRAVFDIDDVEHEVTARSFGFSARAGIRLHVRRWFFASIAGEVGIVGPMVWAADLSVGFAVM